MPTRVRSFCKINLGLGVGPTRADGFHGLVTLYQTLALHDRVTVQARPAANTTVTLVANHAAVPSDAGGNAAQNTAYKVVTGALSKLKLTAEVHITIDKRLPIQGGLGAGSANAAAALIALEAELGQALPGPERLELAAEVGSDVPLFLLGGTVLGLSRGEAVYPMPDSPALPIVVAVPEVGVSTAQAFRDLDVQMAASVGSPATQTLTQTLLTYRLEQLSRVLVSPWTLTGAGRVPTGIVNSSPSLSDDKGGLPSGSGLSASGAREKSDLAENPLLTLVRTGIENDFESVAFRQHPSLCDIKRALRGETAGSSNGQATQALYAALSGSGSALFGIYGSPESAREAQQRVQSLGHRALLTEMLPRSAYWHRMFA